MSRKAFQRAVAGVALAAAFVPAAAMAESRYVPGYEPSRTSETFGLLGAYGMATVSYDSQHQVVVVANRAAPSANLAADFAAPRLSAASTQFVADLQSAILPTLALAAPHGSASSFQLASRR